MEKLDIGFYPYAFVRTNVMRSKLLKKEDYRKLMKMKVSEITKYLQEIHYKDDINYFGGEYPTAELIELALSRNIDRSFKKLRRICDQPDLDLLVDAYLTRYAVWNVKTILRALRTGQDKEEAIIMLSDAGAYPKEFYADVLRTSDTMDEALDKLMKVNFVEPSMKGGELRDIESSLQKKYYSNLLEIAEKIPSQVNLFKEMIEVELEITNILTLIRLTREGVPREKIEELLITPENLQSSIMKRLLKLSDAESMLEELSKRGYGKGLEIGLEEYKEKGSLVGLERELKRHLLNKTILLLHQNILSPNVILGYMIAKEIDVRNLRLIIKGKKLGVDEDFIKKELVI